MINPNFIRTRHPAYANFFFAVTSSELLPMSRVDDQLKQYRARFQDHVNGTRIVFETEKDMMIFLLKWA